MTDVSQGPYTPEAQQHFLSRLTRLRQDDLAVLRGNLGERLHAARGGYVTIARLTGGGQGWPYRTRDDYFLVATVAAVVLSSPHVGNFGASLRRLQQAVNRDLAEAVERLLESDRDQLSRHMGNFALDLARERVPVNVHLLLTDVLAWTAESRHVQRRWADSFVDVRESLQSGGA